jgi:hypothetical protein
MAPKIVGMELSGRAIRLTDEERAAVLELALRPTYAIEPRQPDAVADARIAQRNAALMARAARITEAGSAGLLPAELHAEVAELLREAVHDTRHELWREEHGLERWRAGDADHRLAGVPEEEHERCYAEQIDRCQRMLDALMSLAGKIQAW